MKIVINRQYGAFDLSQLALEKLIEWGVPVMSSEEAENKTDLFVVDRELTPPEKREENFEDNCQYYGRYWCDLFSLHYNRNHPLLIKLVEKLGESANGNYSSLKIVDVPDDVKWKIEDYDGMEIVREVSRSWC